MLALIAALLFAIALVLDLLDTAGDATTTLMLGGLVCVALHLVGLGTAWSLGAQRRP